MHKKVVSSEEMRSLALRAISIVAGVVKRTLGPGGNPILIQRSGQNPDGTPVRPLITKDGVTVAEHTKVRDPAIDTIIQAVMEVAQKTVQDGGDGTTTSVVLAEAIYKAGFKYAQQGTNGIELYEDLNAVKDKVLKELDAIKKDLVSDEDVFNVAKISANGDEEIAGIVFDALKAAGEDGYVSLEEGYTRETTLQTVEGAVYKRGWRNFAPNGSLQVNDKARNINELVNPAVLIYAGKLESLNELQDTLMKIWRFNESTQVFEEIIPLMIIAHDYSDDVKNKILQMKIGKMPIGAIKSPADGSPNARTEMLEDLACMLGASVFSKGILELSDLKDEHLGNAERVEIGAEETVFFGYQGSKEAILGRIAELNERLKSPGLHPFDAENIRFRKGKLSGGIAIVNVGGKSELEMREKKDRIEDALCAAKASLLDGVLPGGGLALYNVARKLEKLNRAGKGTIGSKILEEALKEPIKHIIANTGKNAEVVISKMPKGKGYDARNHRYVDMLKEGIIDPAKVTKSALENAVSIAGLLLTTGGALVSDLEPEDGKANPLAAMMGM